MDVGQLDAVSAVLGAIAASAGDGAGEAVKEIAMDTITGTRDRLVDLVRNRLAKDTLGDAKLTVYAAEPTPENGQALEGHLVQAGIGDDQDILALARELLTAAGPAAVAPGSVAATVIKQVNKDGGIGFIGGQHEHHYTDPQQELRELGRSLGMVLEALTPPTDSNHDVAEALIAQRTTAEKTLARWGHLLPKDARDSLRDEEGLLSESQAYLAGTRMGLTWTAPTAHLISLEDFPTRVLRFAENVRAAFIAEQERVATILQTPIERSGPPDSQGH